MKRWLLSLLLLVIFMGLVGGVVLAQSPGPPVATGWYVEPGTLAGPPYRLAGGSWQIDGVVGGARYRLQGTGIRPLQGAGCCCAFLPCTYKH